MRDRIKYCFGIFAIVVGLASCNETKVSDVAIIVAPNVEKTVCAYSGEKVLYEVVAASAESVIRELRITSFNPKEGLKTLLELEQNSKNVAYKFEYNAPEFERDSTEVSIVFEVMDATGKTAKVTRKLIVLSRGVTIKEYRNMVMYAEGSGRPDALNLANVSDMFILKNLGEDETADIYLSFSDKTALFNWETGNDTRFLRYNEFNYSIASAKSILQVFESSKTAEAVADLKVNDVVLVGKGPEAYGVFFITNVIKDAGAMNCVVMDYKEVERTGN